MATASKDELKRYFRTGNLPTEGHFSDLIDSLAHKDDLVALREAMDGVWRHETTDAGPALLFGPGEPPPLAVPASGRVGVGRRAPRYALDVDGWSAAPGRVGSYVPPDAHRPDGPAERVPNTGLWTVPADGSWHTLVSELEDAYAFDLVAQARGGAAYHWAMARAAAVMMPFRWGRRRVDHTRSHGFWLFRLCVRWKRRRVGPSGNRRNVYDLQVGTGWRYAALPDGSDPLVYVHLTQRWGPDLLPD